MGEKKERAAEVAEQKLRTKIDKLQADVAKYESSGIEPERYFRRTQGDRWGSYDPKTGVPLTTAPGDGDDDENNNGGKPLSKSQKKAIAKELKNHAKSRDKLIKLA